MSASIMIHAGVLLATVLTASGTLKSPEVSMDIVYRINEWVAGLQHQIGDVAIWVALIAIVACIFAWLFSGPAEIVRAASRIWYEEKRRVEREAADGERGL